MGDLGAGKTHFVQALASGLEVPKDVRVNSPTFTLVNIYRGGREVLVHSDLYRIERDIEIVELGLDDWIGEAVICVEWADKFPALPIDRLDLRFEVLSASERRIEMSAHGPDSQALLDRFTEAQHKQQA